MFTRYFPSWNHRTLQVFEPLHALNFSLPLGIMGTFNTQLADESDCPRPSAQGLRMSVMNCGRALGFLTSAWLYQYFSAPVMFCTQQRSSFKSS